MSAVACPYRQYICHACGYIYDEAVGDPDSGLQAGTRYEDIPDDWSCPLCGVTKGDFSLYEAPDPALRTAAATPVLARGAGAGVVIVGGGRAGWQMAQALRALDPERPITLVSACTADVYDKPLLSVAMARGLAPQTLAKESGAEAAQRLGVRLLAQTHAVRICPETRTLRTSRGPVPYADLVLAHGAQAVLPKALPAKMVWRVNHLGAYQQLRAALGEGGKDVLIVGAGLVGVELANDLALGGHRVTLIDTADTPLARWREGGAGERLLAAWKTLPIRFLGAVEAQRLERVDGRYALDTACGQRLWADQVVVATGLSTPPRLARTAGLAWDQGIAVAVETLRTSDPHIHALGDCISVQGQSSRFIEPIARQARAIAADICGGPAQPYVHQALPIRVKTSTLPLTLN